MLRGGFGGLWLRCRGLLSRVRERFVSLEAGRVVEGAGRNGRVIWLQLKSGREGLTAHDYF